MYEGKNKWHKSIAKYRKLYQKNIDNGNELKRKKK
jgi:hypothetical protein